MMSISKNIKKLRLEHNLSQKEFAKIAGVSDKAVSTWENGTKEPRMGTIQKIADFFGIKKSDIIEDNDDDLPELTEKDEREIESDLEDMMNSMASAACEGDDDFEDVEAFKSAIKVAMVQAKRIAKKKYTPKKYRK
ncbi:helix-turn-helix domain-containing protein [Megamonas funiformis]|jgi:transcriptional regulator with XRE-family HTH domain|uniref:helix-turn-helix domain-containing protein n=2 Tax=Megamonas TaxID=158846 RepID=UPI001C704ADE|nr:helix-turn-helix transcriptional regulator [Megamonas funiformis]